MRGNLQPGISLGRRRAGGPVLVTDVTVRENTVSGNLDVGIRVAGGLRVTVEGNTVAHNWNTGIAVFDGDSVTVRRNRVYENSRIDTNGRGSFEPEAFGGLAVMDPVGSITVTENDISSNFPGLFTHTAGGIRLLKSLNVQVSITGNTLFANEGDGVLVQGIGTVVRVSGNNITGNRGFGVNNLTSATINAEQNWWASASGPSRGVASADNPEQVAGPLDTLPWATSPIAYPPVP
jgi:parallel beta-helix repeat protein